VHSEDEYDQYIRNVRAAGRMMWGGLAVGLIVGFLIGSLLF